MGDGCGAARVTAAVGRALIRAAGMQAENARLAFLGQAPVHNQRDFEDLIVDEHIDWNSVQEDTRG